MRKYIYKLKVLIFSQILFYGIYVSVTAVFPYMLKLLFDNVLVRGQVYFIKLAFLYGILIVIGESALYISERFVWKTAIAFETAVKKDFFYVVCHLGYRKYKEKDVGEYISLQGNDITALEQDYLTPYIDIFKSIIMIVIYGLLLFVYVDYRIATATLLLSLFTVLIPRLTAKGLSKRRNDYLNQMGRYVNKVREFFEGYKIIDSRTIDAITHNHEESLTKTSMLRYRYGKFKCLSNSLSGVAAKLVYIVVFFLTGFLLLRREITVGTAVAAIGYIECFMSPIQSLLYDFDALNSTKEIKKKVEGYVCADIPSFLKSKKTFTSSIEYEDVNIYYDNFLIKNFNYKFEKGKKYAIIGHSGSGKSTIINAMLGYTDIVSGKITVDGEEVKNIDTSNIFSILNQAETVFNDTFINNVTIFGSYDKYKVKDILENLSCKATKTIEIKENCATLSGGELKVLFLIRMLLKDTNVCIMDEPFSAMDEKTTNILQKVLFKLKDKTIIMITHRLDKDYLEQFDEIILMDSGHITQTGTYKDIGYKIKEMIE